MVDPALSIATGIIARFEGFRSAPYPDCGAGVWTVGYGQTRCPDGSPVGPGTPHVTQTQALADLSLTVARTLGMVRDMAHVPISDNEAAALTSFAYNLGTGALRNSTLLRLLNQGDRVGAAAQFGAWTHAGGHELPGLVRRRTAEAELFKASAPTTKELTADDLNARVLASLHPAT